ncbi:hypothetical protein SSX86_031775 [Deinandra increscens subsp. villosa]|uniref:Uncharacterized protein n=1 Tax=Deinandra increscens subsp. villosa TaxID=3103831 RepID=A0AAP0GH51_9ASTR
MKSVTLRHHAAGDSSDGNSKRIATGILQSITTLWLICAKQAILASRKLKHTSKISRDSPMIQRPKKLIASISNKAITMRHHKKRAGDGDNGGGEAVGDDGVWQREILMGDKCQPLDFSGVIYYDRDGKRTHEFPTRSPRASPLPGYVAKFDWVPPHER